MIGQMNHAINITMPGSVHVYHITYKRGNILYARDIRSFQLLCFVHGNEAFNTHSTRWWQYLSMRQLVICANHLDRGEKKQQQNQSL